MMEQSQEVKEALQRRSETEKIWDNSRRIGDGEEDIRDLQQRVERMEFYYNCFGVLGGAVLGGTIMYALILYINSHN